MSKWKTVRLGDVFELQMGKTPDRKRLDYFKGSHKWISIADISKSEKYISETKESLTDDAISSSGIKIIPKDTVIMSFKLTIGKTAITSNEMYSNEAIMAFLPNKKYETDNSFLYHLFSNKNWSEGSNKAVKGITLNKASLSEMTILLPPLETQKQIAAVLDKCTSLISKYKKILEKYDTLIKSRFIEMFGDPVSNEKGWEVKSLDLCCDGIGDGLHGTPEYVEESDYPFINGNNLDGNIIISSSTKFVSKETFEKHYIFLTENALLLSINGTLGKLAYFNGEAIMLGKSACYLNLKKEINKRFVFGLMSSEFFLNFMEHASTKSTIKNVGLKAIREYKLILPPLSLQNSFASFVQQIDKSKFVVQKSLEKAEILYKSLMQEYFG